jgi:hypothetical protein
MQLLDFRAYLDEMEGLGVLRLLKNDRYAFQNPTVPLLMGSSEDVSSVLCQTRTLETHDPNYFRKVMNRRVSPLTSLQLKEAYGRESGAVILVGSEALGIDDVVQFLRHEQETEVVLADDCTTRVQFTTLNQDTKPTDDKTVFIVAGVDTPWNAAWVEWAIKQGKNRGRNGRRRRWIFLAGPSAAEQMDADIERLERAGASVIRLDRWRESALQAWMNVHRIALPQDKVEGLTNLTDNVPWLLEKFRECLVFEVTATQAFETFAAACKAGEYSDAYSKAAGLSEVAPTVSRFVYRLGEYGDPCSLDELLELTSDALATGRPSDRREAADAIRWGQRMSLVSVKSDGTYQARPDVSQIIR